MNNTEFLAFLFLAFLAAIVFGIFLGIAMAKNPKRRAEPVAATPTHNCQLEQVREEAFARTDGIRRGSILDAEVIE